MGSHDIIVIGASAGGIEALTDLFGRLNPNLHAAVFVVLHISPESKSYLPSILSRLGSLPAAHAEDGQEIKYGRAYIAPPNQHMILEDGQVHLTVGPKENGFRPAVDPLFESAARAYGRRVAGVILSGNLYDGSKGLLAIKKAGGIAMVQDPGQAIYPGMPSNAMGFVKVDYVLSAQEIASMLNMLNTSDGQGREGGMQMNELRTDPPDESGKVIQDEIETYEKSGSHNRRSIFTCPDCGGVLWEMRDEQIVHYRCHVGHIYSPEVLLASQDSQVENAFWTAIRALVEKAALANRLAVRARKNGYTEVAEIYLSQARQSEKDAELLRNTWFTKINKSASAITPGEIANKNVSQSES